MTEVRTIIAVVGEDDRHRAVERAAVERARSERATLILYDRDAAASLLESPLPTEWSAEGTDEAVGDRLGPEELDAAGRAALGERVRRARHAGIDAWGWLPEDKGREALLGYAARQPGPLLLLPEEDPELSAGAVPAEVV